MLNTNDLKSLLHKQVPRQDKLLLILSTFSQPSAMKTVLSRGREAGFKIPTSWNPSLVLTRSAGLAIRTPGGWEITDAGREHLRKYETSRVSGAAAQVAHDLRAHLDHVRHADTRNFVIEAVECFEWHFYRSAVVMSWLAAVHVLHQHVYAAHLAVFNSEASRVDAKWRPAKTTDDLGRIGEADFLDRLVAISVLGKSVKDELAGCLKLRNGCGHPNSLKISTNAVARLSKSYCSTCSLNSPKDLGKRVWPDLIRPMGVTRGFVPL